jgi:hypothetical protein
MPSSIFESIAKQKVDIFRAAFAASREQFYSEDVGRLRHTSEFGAARERICSDFLRMFLPTYLDIGSGFLITSDDQVSSQCDLVIFDPQYTPLVEDANRRRFFPIETVVAIGEVKSVLSKQGLFDSLEKLAANKKIRQIDDLSPARRSERLLLEEKGHHYDQMISFLICEKLDFNLVDITAHVSRHYDKVGVAREHRHNLVLSIEDGLLCYKNHKLRDVAWMLPVTRGVPMKNRFMHPGDSGRNHFGIFTAYLFMMCANATVFMPEIGKYERQTWGQYQDEN